MKKKKNKKINLITNIIESSALFLLITISLIVYSNLFTITPILKVIVPILCVLLIDAIILLEIFFLSIENNKYRIINISYYVVALILLLLLNNFIPFYAIISLLVLNAIKNAFRITNITKIYEYAKFAEYCKIYGIKTRKPRAKKADKVTVTKTKKTTVKTPAKRTRTSKSYA